MFTRAVDAWNVNMKNSWYEFIVLFTFLLPPTRTKRKKNFSAKNAWGSYKKYQETSGIQKNFFITPFLLVLCKFRMVKWKQEGRKRGTFFTPRKAFQLKVYCRLGKVLRFFNQLLCCEFRLKVLMNFKFWFMAAFSPKTISVHHRLTMFSDEFSLFFPHSLKHSFIFLTLAFEQILKKTFKNFLCARRQQT